MTPLVLIIGYALSVFIVLCPIITPRPLQFAPVYLTTLAIMSIVLMIVRPALIKLFPDVESFKRPTKQCGPQQLRSLYDGGFPSGHLASIALCMTMLFTVYPTVWTALIGIVSIIFMGLFRHVLGCHTVLQMAAGTIIGCVTGYYASKQL
jgi:membrane-associated phospholipid phosphatase